MWDSESSLVIYLFIYLLLFLVIYLFYQISLKIIFIGFKYFLEISIEVVLNL